VPEAGHFNLANIFVTNTYCTIKRSVMSS